MNIPPVMREILGDTNLLYQLVALARAAVGHGIPRIERAAQLAEDDLLDLVRQSIQPPRGAALQLGAVGTRGVLEQRDAGAQLRRGQLLRRLLA